jgi:preprotein translocase subunit SecE
MGKEKNVAVGAIWLRELFQVGIYKRSQGRIARQVTFGAIFVVLLLISYRLHERLVEYGAEIQFTAPVILALAGGWIAYRLVNLPRFADFLISVELEMNKVSWPSRGELWRALLVVLFSIVFLTCVLWAFDIFWQTLLHLVGVF